MSLIVYRFLTIILSPLIDLYLFFRLIRGKEDRKRFGERFGCTKLERPSGKLIWFQCASVGEGNSALPLIYKIIEKYKDNISVLITTGTMSSASIIGKKIEGKKNIIHQYTPIDKYFVVKRFLKHWRPDILITIESELWPNLITMSKKVCDKIMIVNAKISEKSFKRWKMFRSLKESIFDSIDICYPQSQEDQFRLINLGIQNTMYLGNLKFDIPKLEINKKFLKTIKDSVGERRMIFCASTHEKENKVILDFYNKIQNDFPNIIFILGLRHPEESEKTYKFFTTNGKKLVKRKSLDEVIDLSTNIYIYDEMNEIGTLFEASDIVVMGGSLVNGMGGHTPVEPAKHMCAIFTGPYIKNNKSLFLELEKNNGCVICSDNNGDLINNLYSTASSLIKNEKKVTELKLNAYAVCEKFSNVADKVARNIILNINN